MTQQTKGVWAIHYWMDGAGWKELHRFRNKYRMVDYAQRWAEYKLKMTGPNGFIQYNRGTVTFNLEDKP